MPRLAVTFRNSPDKITIFNMKRSIETITTHVSTGVQVLQPMSSSSVDVSSYLPLSSLLRLTMIGKPFQSCVLSRCRKRRKPDVGELENGDKFGCEQFD